MDVYGQVVVSATGAEESTPPIAAGEFLRRLAGKMFMRHPTVRTATHALHPLQCEVGIPEACSMVAMGLQQCVDVLHGSSPTGWAVLQVDLSNAFNSLRRRRLLGAVAACCPEAMPWMAYCYGKHTPLYLGTTIVESQSGVQQGDPCGPLAFAWGIQDVLEEVAATVSWQAWYLDD